MTCIFRPIARAAALLAILLAPYAAQAQVLYGSLTGHGNRLFGHSCPWRQGGGAERGYRHRQAGHHWRTGRISLQRPSAGHHNVAISAASFGGVLQRGLVVEANTEKRADVQLTLSQLSRTIIVDASVSTLQTDCGDVSSQLRTSQIGNLPESGARNFPSLYKLVPGFSPPAASHSEAGNPQSA